MIFLELTTDVNLTKRFRSIISNLFSSLQVHSVIKVASSRMNFVEFIIDTSPLGILLKTLLFFILLRVFFSSVIFGCNFTAGKGGNEKLSSNIEKPSIEASVQPVPTLMLATTLQNEEALTIDFEEVL